MQLFTPVNIAPSPLRIDHQTPLLLVGSCFTDEVGARLQAAGFECLCNPFGTLYNPFSVALCLQKAVNDEPIGSEHLVQHEGLWHSWLHHGRFSDSDKQTVLHSCNEAIHATHHFLQRSPVVFCTFGTAYTFFLSDPSASSAMQGRPVANCHKLPAAMFRRRRLSVSEIVECWQPLVSALSVPFVFTVSPIRHLTDGAHGNQLSKSTLLLAVDQLVRDSDRCGYFDSYEILMDELRDYRFYARDLCHPTDVAVDIIWERFQQTYMADETRTLARQKEKEWRQRQHRPLHPPQQ